MHEASIYHELF